ncbi:protein NO VEIN domain-containing protein [Streptacidiphilus sp. N1-12]|uniref:Protein NO VEIN domain-containing protein n=2 Tax=Streptacidiphilus alkalitolerans TaxID=3342712 RepID=A0ABV6V920_9ACTN
MGNQEIERIAINYVLTLERAEGRKPTDVSTKGYGYDVHSPPRKIEVKAFGRSARGAPVPLEERQLAEFEQNPELYYVYVVDNVGQSDGAMSVRVLHGQVLRGLIERAKPSRTYWSTLRVAEYDAAERLQ